MALFSKLFNKLRGGAAIDVADWEELKRTLIESDLGAALTEEIVTMAKRTKAEDIESAILGTLSSHLAPTSRSLQIAEGRVTSILVVGVNGTGKTTSVAKLMKFFKDHNRRVLVAAADTFRAAAIDQIETWGERIGVPVVVGKFEGDPASVAFDGIKRAMSEQSEIFIVDTAGRLHTKSGLMDELAKIRRVVEKVSPVDEVLLVVDATTGQNGISQAKLFSESVAVTGIILTKMDGSAKGGIALAIESQTSIPVKLIGVGESASDLRLFDTEAYLRGLIA
jgi:fused signal recognition particle receptor